MFNLEYDDRLKDNTKSCYQLIKTITKLVYYTDIAVEPMWWTVPFKTKYGFMKFKTSTVYICHANQTNRSETGRSYQKLEAWRAKALRTPTFSSLAFRST